MESGEASGKTGVRFLHHPVGNSLVYPTVSPSVTFCFRGKQEGQWWEWIFSFHYLCVEIAGVPPSPSSSSFLPFPSPFISTPFSCLILEFDNVAGCYLFSGITIAVASWSCVPSLFIFEDGTMLFCHASLKSQRPL